MSDISPATGSRDKPAAGKAIEIKGNMYTLMSIHLQTSDLPQIDAGLQERVIQAPEFFKNTPVIIDFSRIAVTAQFDFKALFKLVRTQQLLPVAVRGIAEEMREPLQQAGVPIVEQASATTTDESASVAEKSTEKSARPARGRTGAATIVDKPVRSGQQCYAKGGDLVLLSQSSAGSELIADGNIHVYGTLRGRALCGVGGDTNTRIFCSALDADLVSVAGHYKILEEIPPAIQNKPVQIRLSGEQLLIEPLS